MTRSLLKILLVSILLSACTLSGSVESTPTLDVDSLRTAAVSTTLFELTRQAAFATQTPSPVPTETPVPPTVTPTIEVKLEPVAAICTNNATVRSEPRKGSDNLGGVFYNQGIKVLARNDVATWYYILWQDSPTGKAWVTARAFELQGSEIGKLPIVTFDANGDILAILPPILWEVQGAPLPLPPVPTGPEIRPATVIQAANVRVCPSLGCLVIGTVQLNDQVNMTGRYGENEWALIDYPSGPGGKGWVARDSLQPGSEAFGSLPYYNVLGTPVTPEPPTPTLDPNITPTVTNTPEPTPAGPRAVVDDKTVIYAEPSTLSTELGVLNAKDEIYVTGIAVNGLYYQIQYPAFTDGRAYVSQKYIRVLGDMRYLPYFDEKGNLLPTPQQ